MPESIVNRPGHCLLRPANSPVTGLIVVDGQTGPVCSEETVACLASNTLWFLGDLRFRTSCARATSSRFNELYSDERIRQRWVEFLGGAA
jgi:hypothetical protein